MSLLTLAFAGVVTVVLGAVSVLALFAGLELAGGVALTAIGLAAGYGAVN